MENRKTWLDTYAGWVAGKRSRWVTLFVWILLAVILNMAFPQANSLVDDAAENLDSSKPSVQASELLDKEYPNENGLPALIVWYKSSGLASEDIQNLQTLIGQLSDSPLPHQAMIPPLHTLPPEVFRQQVSDDGTTFIMPLFFNNGVDSDKLKASMTLLSEQMESITGENPFNMGLDSDQLSARVTGPVGILIDATQLFSAGDFSLTIATFMFVLIVLLLIYRSPILAFTPLVGVAFAYALLSPILGWFGERGWIIFDSQSLSIMTVLLFGAGTDYCLFMIARYRQFLTIERDKWVALRQAVSDKSGAIAMSALTTVFALSFLLLADFGSIQRFAIPFVSAVFLVALSSLTLVPAILAILGRASFFPFIPRTPEMIEERAKAKGKPVPKPRTGLQLGKKLSYFVVDRARAVTILATIVLIILASFALQIKTTYDILASFPEDMPSREGFTLIGEAFNEGQLAPVRVIVDTRDFDGDLKGKLASLSYVGNVSDPVRGQNNENIQAFDIELKMNPYSNEAMDVLPELRELMESALSLAGITDADQRVWLAGQTAEQYDIRATSSRDAFILVPLILVIIAVLVLIYLRSIVAMAYLLATVVVSYFSALGLGWIIIHYVMGADAIQGFIPLYTFIFLGALGVDYNIFMKSSIWKKARYLPLNQAIKEGARETGAVISSAGIILAGTFAVLATLPIQVLVHFGLITAIGVLIDTFIVRPFLVPAINAWIGKKSFWPGKYEPVEESIESPLKELKGLS